MEFYGDDGSKISITPTTPTEFGRSSLKTPNNQTISRRHIIFKLPKTLDSKEPRVHFTVVGKNPIWVLTNGDKDLFRSSEKGEMRIGDSFFVAAKDPVLFKLKRSVGGEGERSGGLDEILQSGVDGSELGEELGSGDVDVSNIDAVKEFGFLVIGHEFDNYPKSKIRPFDQWNWFLEESRVDSDTDEDSETNRSKGKKSIRKKRKGEPEDDEEWTGDSEDEKEVISTVAKAKKPRYTTRSKDSKQSSGDAQNRKKPEQKKRVRGNEDEDDEEEEDDEDDEETLGGFIVNDEELGEEDEDEEEEEFEDNDEDEDD